MSSPRKSNDLGVRKSQSPKTPEEMETYLIGLAYKRTEKQILDGNVSPTTLNYFLRLGGTRAEIELEKLKNENHLLSARTSAIEAEENLMSLFAQAMDKFGVYAGETQDDQDEDWVDDDR